MLKIFNHEYAPWYERTMSSMQNAELERAENFLRTLQPLHLFGGCRVGDLPTMWQMSYDGAEHPHADLPEDVSEWEARILQRLPLEVHLLSSPEYMLIQRLITQKGKILLLNRGELLPCVSFIRRMWAYPVMQSNGSILLIMPDEILFTLYELTNTPEFLQQTRHYPEYWNKTELILLAQGILPMDLALEAYEKLLGKSFSCNYDLCMRMFSGFADCAYLNGQSVLVHSCIYDAAPFVSTLQTYPQGIYTMDLDKDLEQWNACEDVFLILSGLIRHAVRNDVLPDELVGDLALLAKQNAPFDGLLDTLKYNLVVQPTQEMIDALHLLKSHVPVWPVFRSEVNS